MSDMQGVNGKNVLTGNVLMGSQFEKLISEINRIIIQILSELDKILIMTGIEKEKNENEKENHLKKSKVFSQGIYMCMYLCIYICIYVYMYT
jgi:hypothetical protein